MGRKAVACVDTPDAALEQLFERMLLTQWSYCARIETWTENKLTG